VCINKLKNWYAENEKNGNFEPSGVETTLFYVGILGALVFCVVLFAVNNREVWIKSTVLFIPTIYWGYLRSSRKDMKATGYLISGAFGAVGGTAAAIILRIFM